MSLKIEIIKTGALSVNSVIIYNTDTLKCSVFDVGDFDPIDNFITDNKLIPDVVIATHGHFDHLFGVSEFCKKYSCPFAMSSDDNYFINSPDFDVIKSRAEDLGYFNYIPPTKIDIDLKGKSKFNSMDLFWVPGHSPGGLCFYIKELKTLISGDTLFYETIGRTDLIYGDYDLLVSEIESKLLALPDDTTVIPGHGYFTTIKHEKEFNPFLNKNPS